MKCNREYGSMEQVRKLIVLWLEFEQAEGKNNVDAPFSFRDYYS